MYRREETALRRWLAAEHDGRDAAAEHALRGLFAALPAAAPAPGFSDRVLAALPLHRPVTVRRPGGAQVEFYPWWSRAAIAACLLVAGLAATLALPLAFAVARLIAPGEAIGGAVQGFIAVASRVDELLSMWQVWARIVDTILVVATAPPVVLALLTLTVLSALTFRGLKRALVSHRSPEHVAAF